MTAPPGDRTLAPPNRRVAVDLAADVEIAHAAEAHAQPAGHLLLHRDLARNTEFARRGACSERISRLDPQVKKTHRPVRDPNRSKMRSTLAGSLEPVPSSVTTSTVRARIAETGDRHHQRTRARAQNCGDADPTAAASSASGARVASPTPRPTTTIFLQPGSISETITERAQNVDRLSSVKRGQSARACAGHLVKESISLLCASALNTLIGRRRYGVSSPDAGHSKLKNWPARADKAGPLARKTRWKYSGIRLPISQDGCLQVRNRLTGRGPFNASLWTERNS